MTAYVVVDIEVTDPIAYEGYKKAAAESIASMGGRYLTRGGKTEVLEGTWTPKRFVIIEFPSMKQLKEWYASPGYAPLLALRKMSTKTNLIVSEGV